MKTLRTSDKTSRLMGAIGNIQAKMPLVEKSETVKIQGGGETRVEKFAPLDEVWRKLQPLCKEYGLTVVQFPGISSSGGGLITTRIEWTGSDYESEWIEGDIPVQPPKPGFRDFGAFYSYARRIALLSSFGIVPCGEDPDHQEAEQIKTTSPPRANRAARPNGAQDAESEVEKILEQLRDLPPGSPRSMVDELSKQMGALSRSIKSETNDRVRKAFSDKRKELGLS